MYEVVSLFSTMVAFIEFFCDVEVILEIIHEYTNGILFIGGVTVINGVSGLDMCGDYFEEVSEKNFNVEEFCWASSYNKDAKFS